MHHAAMLLGMGGGGVSTGARIQLSIFMPPTIKLNVSRISWVKNKVFKPVY